MTDTSSLPTYRGLGDTLEKAVEAAHAKIPRRDRETVICRVLQWGYQHGGYVDGRQFYALVVEDSDLSPLK
jgi:hypothetical protein